MPDPTPSIELRAAVPADALCLAVLAMQVWLDTYAPYGIRTAIARHVLETASVQVYDGLLANPDVAIVVAEHDAHLVGFAQVDFGGDPPLTIDGEGAELHRLYVQEPFTGRGVGRRLLQRAEGIAAARGARTLWLTAYTGNTRALAFYPAQSYRTLGETVYAFEGEEVPNLVFGKTLDA